MHAMAKMCEAVFQNHNSLCYLTFYGLLCRRIKDSEFLYWRNVSANSIEVSIFAI